jgi:Pectate lyase superfamily protein
MISRRIIAATALLCMFLAPAHAQQNKAALTAEVNANWPDNVVGAITPAILRSTVIDIINSYYDLNGNTSLGCAAHQWVLGLPTLSSIACSRPNFSDLSGSISPSQIPPPTATTLGGIESILASAHQWVAYVDTSGVPHQSQPGFSDLSGSLAPSQCPVFTSGATGCVPASGGGTTAYLRADGSFNVPSGGGNVVGSGATTAGHVAVFNNTSATGIQDGGTISNSVFGRTGTVVAANGDYNSGQITHTPPGTGGVATTVAAELSKFIWVTDYGAVCNGSTDDTTAIQAAINQAVTIGGGIVRLPVGSCASTGTLSITGTMTLQGSGRASSALFGTGGVAQQQITISTNAPVYLRDFTLTTTSTKTGGWGIQVNGTGGSPENDESEFENLLINGQVTGLDFETAAYWTVRDCIFGPSVNPGNQVVIRNTTTPDAGNSKFIHNFFVGGPSGMVDLIWQSSGGLRIIDNYFLGNGTASTGIFINALSPVSTGIIVINGNTFDGPTSSAITITTGAGSVLTNIPITGNTFDGSPTNHISINQGTSSTLGGISITGNTLIANSSSVVGISIPTVGSVAITGNVIVGGTTAINLGSGVASGVVTSNLVSGSAVNNGSGANVTLANNH